MERAYDFSRAQAKWDTLWADNNLTGLTGSTGLTEWDNNRPESPFFSILPVLTGQGRELTGIVTNIIARRKQMQGYNVLCFAETGLNPAAGEKANNRAREDGIKQRFVQLFQKGLLYAAKDRWFFKTTALSVPATAAVKKDEILFSPGEWRDVCLEWLENVGDRCVSCTEGPGVLVPAYRCTACKEITAALYSPDACPCCGSSQLPPTGEIMSGDFASALEAVNMLNRLKKSPGLEGFYPVSLVTAGVGNVFPWVPFFLLTGLEAGNREPVSEVLVNGLVHQKSAGKRTTAGIAAEMAGIADECGKDAQWFSLAMQAAPGTDVSLSMNRIKDYRSFIKKIWNAARFVMQNPVKPERSGTPARENLSNPDKWILHGLNNTVEKVNDRMDNYRIHEAAALIYRFFRREFCDWYLEFARCEPSSEGTSKTLTFVLGRLMELMHPFMPYITQEIYQQLYNGGGFLLKKEYPSFKGELVFSREYKEIEVLKKVIAATRRTRALNGIAPSARKQVCLMSESEKETAAINDNIKYFDLITRSSGTLVVEDFTGFLNGYKGRCLNWEILLPCSDNEELQDEIKNLEARLEKLDSQIAVLESRLSDDSYRKDAAKRVVASFKRSLQEKIGRRDRMLKAIHDLTVQPKPPKKKKAKKKNAVDKTRKKASNE